MGGGSGRNTYVEEEVGSGWCFSEKSRVSVRRLEAIESQWVECTCGG